MVYNTLEFPYAEFGEGLTRKVRMPISRETTGEERLNLVFTQIPAGAISEGHVHPDADEYIYFEIEGKAILGGEELHVPAHGILHAKAGVSHECINTSSSETLNLFCVFVPPFEPYGKYPALIEATKKHLEKEAKK